MWCWSGWVQSSNEIDKVTPGCFVNVWYMVEKNFKPYKGKVVARTGKNCWTVKWNGDPANKQQLKATTDPWFIIDQALASN